MVKIGINGFGRIGRLILRALLENYKEMISVPYKNIKKYFINNEAFEAYPNRNSLIYNTFIE